MNQDQIKIEEPFLLFIDLYNIEDEKNRQYFLKYRKNNPDSGLRKEPFISFYSAFESKVSRLEITDFLYYFGSIRLLKTFHYSHHAVSLIESFKKLELSIPHFIIECQKEVIQREVFIKAYFEKEKYKWSKSQREDFLSDIQKEAKNHSFDQKSGKEYLKKEFKESIKEVRKIEEEINKRFGYHVRGFFDGEVFRATKEDLNEYFYHSELHSRGYGSYFEICKSLSEYVTKKNTVFALRGFLSSQKDSIGRELILTAEPKNKFTQMPFEEVRFHFLPLIKQKTPKREIWMTNEDFEFFLRRSLGREEGLIKPKINLGFGAKYAIVELFYGFYEKCQKGEYNQNRNKEPFVELLKNAFDTKIFDNIDNSNFKPKKSKYEWKYDLVVWFLLIFLPSLPLFLPPLP